MMTTLTWIIEGLLAFLLLVVGGSGITLWRMRVGAPTTPSTPTTGTNPWLTHITNNRWGYIWAGTNIAILFMLPTFYWSWLVEHTLLWIGVHLVIGVLGLTWQGRGSGNFARKFVTATLLVLLALALANDLKTPQKFFDTKTGELEKKIWFDEQGKEYSRAGFSPYTGEPLKKLTPEMAKKKAKEASWFSGLGDGLDVLMRESQHDAHAEPTKQAPTARNAAVAPNKMVSVIAPPAPDWSEYVPTNGKKALIQTKGTKPVRAQDEYGQQVNLGGESVESLRFQSLDDKELIVRVVFTQ